MFKEFHFGRVPGPSTVDVLPSSRILFLENIVVRSTSRMFDAGELVLGESLFSKKIEMSKRSFKYLDGRQYLVADCDTRQIFLFCFAFDEGGERQLFFYKDRGTSTDPSPLVLLKLINDLPVERLPQYLDVITSIPGKVLLKKRLESVL